MRACSGLLLFLFQSTHPVRGATAAGGALVPKPFNFNPRTP